jgi:hypothetical protein
MWSPLEIAYLTMVVLSFVLLAVVLYGVDRYCRVPSRPSRIGAAISRSRMMTWWRQEVHFR